MVYFQGRTVNLPGSTPLLDSHNLGFLVLILVGVNFSSFHLEYPSLDNTGTLGWAVEPSAKSFNLRFLSPKHPWSLTCFTWKIRWRKKEIPDLEFIIFGGLIWRSCDQITLIRCLIKSIEVHRGWNSIYTLYIFLCHTSKEYKNKQRIPIKYETTRIQWKVTFGVCFHCSYEVVDGDSISWDAKWNPSQNAWRIIPFSQWLDHGC